MAGRKKVPEYHEHDLDAKELIFAESYILTQNASQAARDAGFQESFAGVAGHRLKKDPRVKAYIEERIGCKLSELRMGVDDLLEELQARAMFSAGEIYEDDGSVKRTSEMSPLALRMLEGLDTVELFGGSGDDKHAIGLVKKVKIRSSDKAFEHLLKYHGLLRDKVEVTGANGKDLFSPEQIVGMAEVIKRKAGK